MCAIYSCETALRPKGTETSQDQSPITQICCSHGQWVSDNIRKLHFHFSRGKKFEKPTSTNISSARTL